jgi:hypothetical protein
MAVQPKSGRGLPIWGFITIIFLTWLDCWSSAQPPTWRTRPPYLRPPETGWPSYIPMHWVPILVAFYDVRGLQRGVVFNPCHHTGQ